MSTQSLTFDLDFLNVTNIQLIRINTDFTCFFLEILDMIWSFPGVNFRKKLICTINISLFSKVNFLFIPA